MKGAIVILLMLFMGWLTAQSFDAHGYTLNTKDKIFLQGIYNKIDNKDISHVTQNNFLPYLDYFPKNSKKYILLHEIYAYVRKDTKKENTAKQTKYPNAFIALLGDQF